MEHVGGDGGGADGWMILLLPWSKSDDTTQCHFIYFSLWFLFLFLLFLPVLLYHSCSARWQDMCVSAMCLSKWIREHTCQCFSFCVCVCMCLHATMSVCVCVWSDCVICPLPWHCRQFPPAVTSCSRFSVSSGNTRAPTITSGPSLHDPSIPLSKFAPSMYPSFYPSIHSGLPDHSPSHSLIISSEKEQGSSQTRKERERKQRKVAGMTSAGDWRLKMKLEPSRKSKKIILMIKTLSTFVFFLQIPFSLVQFPLWEYLKVCIRSFHKCLSNVYTGRR